MAGKACAGIFPTKTNEDLLYIIFKQKKKDSLDMTFQKYPYHHMLSYHMHNAINKKNI